MVEPAGEPDKNAPTTRPKRTATGLGGRPRRLGDDGERARKAVTARIRDTLRRLEDRHPALAQHLSDALATGAGCRYDPPEPVTWET
jgi:hypothetical protein